MTQAGQWACACLQPGCWFGDGRGALLWWDYQEQNLSLSPH